MPIVGKHCHMLSTSFETLKNPRVSGPGVFFVTRGYIRPHATITHIVTLLTAVNEVSLQPSNAVASQDQQRWKVHACCLAGGIDLFFDAKNFQRQRVSNKGLGWG
jgi:hypothetical protein